jgi:osmotically-inducible protein OsmY
MNMHKWLLLALLVLAPLLEGCFPLIAGGALIGGALMVADRRSAGTQVDDGKIEIKAIKGINDKYREASHVNVTSYNRNVLLSGEARDDSVKQDAEKIVREIEGVRNVFNEVTIAGNSSLGARSNDSLITSKVKGRFLTAGGNKFQPNHVKVVTENSIVYLLGLVTKAEGEAASEVTSTTAGVQRVVKLFEYIEPEKKAAKDKK